MDTELYWSAAEILRKAAEKSATTKSLIYASEYKNIRQLFALVNECAKYKQLLEEVLSHIDKDFHKDEIFRGSKNMEIVLLYEQLLGRKFGRNVGLRKLFLSYKPLISKAVEQVLSAHDAKNLQAAAAKLELGATPKIPRYMRVNLIKLSVEEAVEELQAEGWEYVGNLNQTDFQTTAMSMTSGQFGLDPVLPDVLVFAVGTDLHEHHMTLCGKLVQQDRASCIPAHVLNPLKDSVVLDCCAAPGNKTSHLASLMQDSGRVIALDRDYKRMSTMSRLLEVSGATCVELVHQDFLSVQPTSDDANNVQYILVDPSCSGSGMLSTQNLPEKEEMDRKRVETLKRFQISILKHALRFPNVKRVVYSTCSIYRAENEEVVEEVMQNVSGYFRFVPALPSWQGSRGLPKFSHADCFLRLTPEKDLTQGFFVACFERVEDKDKKKKQTEGQESVRDFSGNSFPENSVGVVGGHKNKPKQTEETAYGENVHKIASTDTGNLKYKKHRDIEEENTLRDGNIPENERTEEAGDFKESTIESQKEAKRKKDKKKKKKKDKVNHGSDCSKNANGELQTEGIDTQEDNCAEIMTKSKKKKRKREKEEENASLAGNSLEAGNGENPCEDRHKSKKKKKKDHDHSQVHENPEEERLAKKKSKKRKKDASNDCGEFVNDENRKHRKIKKIDAAEENENLTGEELSNDSILVKSKKKKKKKI